MTVASIFRFERGFIYKDFYYCGELPKSIKIITFLKDP